MTHTERQSSSNGRAKEVWTVESLRAFEQSILEAYQRGEAKGAVHLSRGNEAQLIEIFKKVKTDDYVFSTYRSHYHALLCGIPEEEVRAQIMLGNSINLTLPSHRFYSSSIVGGSLPIAVGTALAIKRRKESTHVWCFVGDMAASCGMFKDCEKFARGHDLPIMFVVEDNGMSTNTPTRETWGDLWSLKRQVLHYDYKRELPHSGYR